MSAPSRIRLVHVTVGLRWGGAENLMADILMRLDRSRFDLHVVALQRDGPVGRRLRQAGLPVTALGAARWDATVGFRLRRFLRRLRPDVVHSHLFRANAFASLAKGSARLVWHDHCLDDFLGPVARSVEPFLIRRSDRVLVVSEELKRRTLRRLPWLQSRVAVVANGVDAARFRPCSAEERRQVRARDLDVDPSRPLIGFIGRLDASVKGLWTLLDSVPVLRRLCPGAAVVIVGEGKDRDDLVRRASGGRLTDVVRFVGPREFVERIHPALDVFVLPSSTEGFGLAILEAMASARPVVSTRVGGIPEIVVEGETGLLVPPGDPARLAQACAALLNDPERARRMGERGRRRAEEMFSLDGVVRTLSSLYEELAAS